MVVVRLTVADENRLAAAWRPYRQRVSELMVALRADQLDQLVDLLATIDPVAQPLEVEHA